MITTRLKETFSAADNTVTNIRIFTDILWRVYHILTEPVLLYIATWAGASLFSRFTDTNLCGTGSVKTRKTRHKISVDIRIFFYSEGGARVRLFRVDVSIITSAGGLCVWTRRRKRHPLANGVDANH